MRRDFQACLIAAAACLMGTMSGCATQTHAEAKQAAYDRWADARAGILYSMAMQQFEVGDLDKAERSCLQGIAAKADKPDFYELMARVRIEKGDLERAYDRLSQAIQLDPKRYRSHYLLGVVRQRWQKYDDALASYEAAYQCKPDEVAPLLAVSEMLVKLGRSEEASARLRAKLVYFEHNAAIRVAIARIDMMHGRQAEAVSLFREATMLAPEDLSILEHLAFAEFTSAQYSEATYHIEKLLANGDYADRDDLRVLLGDCYLKSGKPQIAGEHYLKVTRRDGNNVDAWIKLAQACSMVHDSRRLNDAADRILRMAPNRYEGHVLKGMAMQALDKPAQALVCFDRATTLAPGSALPHILKGMLLEKAGNVPAAAECYRTALRVDPNDPRGKRLLAGLDTTH